MASLDYAYMSQFFSNAVAYMSTEWGNMQQKIKDAQYEQELPTSDYLNCLHGFQDSVEFADNGVTALQSCPSTDEIEGILTEIVSNRW